MHYNKIPNSNGQDAMTMKIRSNERLKAILPPSNYLDKLMEELRLEFLEFLNLPQLADLEKLLYLVENDYRKYGLIGKGYHCLEHSLELALLVLKSWNSPEIKGSTSAYDRSSLPRLSPAELLELGTAAILHDYDPHSKGGVPRVERTLFVLKTDQVLKSYLEKLGLNPLRISLLIERTDYPFTDEKELLWNGRLLLHFSKPEERSKFSDRASKLALFDKASTYYSLFPEDAQKRVEALAEELNFPKEKLLAGTHEFLLKEKIAQVERWAPEQYRHRWKLAERHFQILLNYKILNDHNRNSSIS